MFTGLTSKRIKEEIIPFEPYYPTDQSQKSGLNFGILPNPSTPQPKSVLLYSDPRHLINSRHRVSDNDEWQREPGTRLRSRRCY